LSASFNPPFPDFSTSFQSFTVFAVLFDGWEEDGVGDHSPETEKTSITIGGMFDA
jgi:hypothetical protein